jgi:hypothetical protein
MRRRAISYKARSRNRGPNGSAALGPAPHAGGYGASGEEGASSSQQRTECMPQSNDLSRSLAALGPAAGSFTVDFPEHRQASGWRRFLPWVFGLLTLFALVLVVLHFGTIEQFTRLAWAARLSGFSSHASPKQQPMCVHLWCGGRRYGVPDTHDGIVNLTGCGQRDAHREGECANDYAAVIALLISAQTRNVCVLEALCSAAVR